MRRTLVMAVALVAAAVQPLSAVAQQGTAANELPPLVQRAQPGAGQRALQPLVGTWRVEKQLFVAIGTPERPALGERMVTRREWIGDGRFLRSTTEGTLGGAPYFRTGLMGYDNMERRYQWVTADNFTPTLMSYQAAPGSGLRMPIDMAGTFTDLGVTGEQNVGRSIPMRTRVRIESEDRHVFEIYFTAPGKQEVLADRMVFTRIR